MTTFKLSAACVVLAVVPALIALFSKHTSAPVKWARTVPFVKLSDGRHLAYEVRGNPKAKHTAVYVHGTPSCRLEFLGLNQDILNGLDLRLIGVDKPGYGQSDPHYGRSLQGFVKDLEELADHHQLQRFLLIGVSGGGPFSWAAARYIPHRVQGVLIFSGAGNLGKQLAHVCVCCDTFVASTLCAWTAQQEQAIPEPAALSRYSEQRGEVSI